MLDTTAWLNTAFRDLLRRVYGGEIPEGYQRVKVRGRLFDEHRKVIEKEYHLTEDEDLFTEWRTLLLFQQPRFYTDEDTPS
jgi:hypothetical protein